MVAIVPKRKRKIGFWICHVPTSHNFESSKMEHTRTTKQSVCNRINNVTTCKLAEFSTTQVLESKTNKSNIEAFDS
jgi:hypothetical protein